MNQNLGQLLQEVTANLRQTQREMTAQQEALVRLGNLVGQMKSARDDIDAIKSLLEKRAQLSNKLDLVVNELTRHREERADIAKRISKLEEQLGKIRGKEDELKIEFERAIDDKIEARLREAFYEADARDGEASMLVHSDDSLLKVLLRIARVLKSDKERVWYANNSHDQGNGAHLDEDSGVDSDPVVRNGELE